MLHIYVRDRQPYGLKLIARMFITQVKHIVNEKCVKLWNLSKRSRHMEKVEDKKIVSVANLSQSLLEKMAMDVRRNKPQENKPESA